jgi:hypothetical protein
MALSALGTGSITVLLAACSNPESPNGNLPPTVRRYDVFEQTFPWKSGGYANPWEQVSVTMTLRAPSGRTVTVGGFHHPPDMWKARFAPAEIGAWTWQAVITDGDSSARSDGRFDVVASEWPGFVRSSRQNRFRWVFDDGTPYYPIGIGDCMIRKADGRPFKFGLDGDFRAPGERGTAVDIDTYLNAYSAAGITLFRWSVDNCAFGLYRTIDAGGNEYLAAEGLLGDTLVQKLRQHGFRTYMVIFGFHPPGAVPTASGTGRRSQEDATNQAPTSSTAADYAAIKRYVKYVVDRYGAYVDFWELMNEARASDEWYREISGYLREVDPYQHPISTNWERPDLVDISSPHWYQKESEFNSDRETWRLFERWKAAGKPVIVGEQGNQIQNWDDRSAVRMRLRSWTAFFAEGVLIFWNQSGFKDYRNNGAANLYLGPEERRYLKVLQDFTRGFDSWAAMAPARVSDPKTVRAYALTSPTTYAAYLHAFADHVNAMTGITLTIQPQAAGTATWLEPSTGRVLGTQEVGAGSQTLSVPPFIVDLALKVTSPGTGR